MVLDTQLEKLWEILTIGVPYSMVGGIHDRASWLRRYELSDGYS